MDRPKKKLATVTLTDSVELPNTNCNCLNQTTCRVRDAAPEAKKIAVTTALNGAPTASGTPRAVPAARAGPETSPRCGFIVAVALSGLRRCGGNTADRRKKRVAHAAASHCPGIV